MSRTQDWLSRKTMDRSCQKTFTRPHTTSKFFFHPICSILFYKKFTCFSFFFNRFSCNVFLKGIIFTSSKGSVQVTEEPHLILHNWLLSIGIHYTFLCIRLQPTKADEAQWPFILPLLAAECLSWQKLFTLSLTARQQAPQTTAGWQPEIGYQLDLSSVKCEAYRAVLSQSQ